jgi:hypothetical protein
VELRNNFIVTTVVGNGVAGLNADHASDGRLARLDGATDTCMNPTGTRLFITTPATL